MKINRRGWVLKDKEGYYVVSAGEMDTDLAKAKLYPSRSLAHEARCPDETPVEVLITLEEIE